MNSTMLTAIIVAGIFILGVFFSWLSSRQRKINTAHMIKEFEKFVREHQLTVFKEQTLNKNMIGIDRVNSKLIFLENNPLPHKFYLIDLNDLRECKLIKEENAAGHISHIYLKCIYKNKNTPDDYLYFYNEKRDKLYKMLRLSRKAYHWEKSINIFRQTELLS